jgi:hypothetical protein
MTTGILFGRSKNTVVITWRKQSSLVVSEEGTRQVRVGLLLDAN